MSKKTSWLPSLRLALPVGGAAALWALAAGERSVLNSDEPVSGDCIAGPDAELQRLALELKAAALDPLSGRLDYATAAGSEELARVKRAAVALRRFDPASLTSPAEKLAFWINVYNALTLHAIFSFRPKRTVWEVPGFFERAAYNVGGHRFSLSEIEHGVLRANRPAPFSRRRPLGTGDPRRRFTLTDAEFDPRVHFALNCGARSCPPIATYAADRIDAQLDLATRSFIRGETEVVGDRVITSALLKWYRADLGDPGELLDRYLEPEVARQLHRKRITFRRYDWGLPH
jgi:hypothetical protein